MARYTDIDKLIAEYDRVHVCAPGGARKLMVEAPIADVAPRAEVAMEIFEEIEKFRNRTPFGYICFSNDEFEEIKKKYTEGEK